MKNFLKKTALIKITTITVCIIINVYFCKAQELKIYPGANMVMNGNVYLVVNNTAFKNNGTFSESTSKVVFKGNLDTNKAYISGTTNTKFYDLTVNKSAFGVAVKSPSRVRSVLTAAAGILYADSNLTLLSDVSNTARVATVSSGADILGKVMVEKYIPSRRAWRLMTAPVTNSSSIYNTWQNGGVYTPGKGLLVSAPGAGNGLDNGNSSSLKIWDVSAQTYLPVTNTHVPISPNNNGSADNQGYFVFIRGDRITTNFIIPNTNITTITAIGRLQTGTQIFNASSTAGKYTLIGNPYASPIDFNAVTRTNLVKRFYVWDPKLNSLGGYVTLDDLDNDGVFSKSVAGSAQTKQIQSTQAFFVETISNGAASLTIAETDKSTTNNTNVFRPLTAGPTESIRIDLYLLNGDGSVDLADGMLSEYNSIFNDIVTNEDALKFTNINENIGLLRHGTTLGIERRPYITDNDTLFLKLWKTVKRTYQLQLTPENMGHPGMMAFLEDSYLANSTPLSLSDLNVINFSVDSNAASAAADRFRIVFSQAKVLPVIFSSVKAYRLNNNIQVEWKVEEQENTVKYEVEKSTNGADFIYANTAFKNTSGSYNWIDVNGIAGNNFYRIKSTDADGSIKYSQVVNVLIKKGITSFNIQPNPVKDNTLHLYFSNQPAGNYRLNITNNAGQLVHTAKLQISNSSTSRQVKINSSLPSGVYQLQIAGPLNNIETQKIIIIQ
jgi:Secretion system C-terminal sorting domain